MITKFHIFETIIFKNLLNWDLPGRSYKNIFQKSPDADQTIVLSPTDQGKYPFQMKYERTHGLESHAIKHLSEFEPNFVDTMVQKAEAFLSSKKINILNKYSNIIDTKQMTPLNILNMLDYINDKIKTNQKLNDNEQWLYENIIQPMAERYTKQIMYLLNNFTELTRNAIIHKRIVRFPALYKNKPVDLIYNPINNALMTIDLTQNKIMTLYKLHSIDELLNKINFRFSDDVKNILIMKNF